LRFQSEKSHTNRLLVNYISLEAAEREGIINKQKQQHKHDNQRLVAKTKETDSFAMNHQQYQHYKGSMDGTDLDEYLSEYKNQTPLESDHYAGE